MAADVVAHQIARTPQQLDERIGERAGVQSPEDGDVIFDGVPPHTSHLCSLTTDGTEIPVKLVAAVVAMLHWTFMPVDIVRQSLLPVAETAVALSYLLIFSFLSPCFAKVGIFRLSSKFSLLKLDKNNYSE